MSLKLFPFTWFKKRRERKAAFRANVEAHNLNVKAAFAVLRAFTCQVRDGQKQGLYITQKAQLYKEAQQVLDNAKAINQSFEKLKS